MKEKLMNNILLKILSLLIAFFCMADRSKCR